MDHYLFKQLAFVRNQTLLHLDGVTEEMADVIPDGFNNSIRWNLGHIYVVFERFVFQHIELPLHMPAGFSERFEKGTSPSNPPEGVVVPTLQELETLLKDQVERVQEAIKDRLEEKIDPPYTTSAGMVLETLEQFISFNLYHESMHSTIIKMYKKWLLNA